MRKLLEEKIYAIVDMLPTERSEEGGGSEATDIKEESKLADIQTKQSTELSTDLNVITAEINSYKRIAGEAIFEIGRRLKHVKENDLAHGEFGKWLEDVEIHERQAQRLMKVATELSDSKTTTWSELPFRTLYEIATLPPEEREKTHEIPSTGEKKTVDEMTIKELREVKKALKEAEARARQAEVERDSARKSEQIAIRRAEELANKPPEIKEVVPEDYAKIKQENEKLKRKYGNEKMRTVDEKLREEFYRDFARDLEHITEKYGSIVFDGERIKSFGSSNPDYARRVNAFDDFWKRYVNTVLSEQTIIDVEVF